MFRPKLLQPTVTLSTLERRTRAKEAAAADPRAKATRLKVRDALAHHQQPPHPPANISTGWHHNYKTDPQHPQQHLYNIASDLSWCRNYKQAYYPRATAASSSPRDSAAAEWEEGECAEPTSLPLLEKEQHSIICDLFGDTKEHSRVGHHCYNFVVKSWDHTTESSKKRYHRYCDSSEGEPEVDSISSLWQKRVKRVDGEIAAIIARGLGRVFG